ncbi:DUF6415 family natural product biosynthesis protein [Streptomyces roseoverticillatus]|uniref:DUF6415 family natural product biosynthesis protein n=1 Tax=Streptomyces roseoverticillatus TaxID=66429 RepID=A0ABV3IYC9_9ACTN
MTPISFFRPASGHTVVRADGPDHAALLDVVTITRTVSETLRPLPDGVPPDPDELAVRIGLLTGHINLLLPLAEAEHQRTRPAGAVGPGLVGYGLAYARRRAVHQPPDPHDSLGVADAWARESARCVQALLGLAVADGREHQHAGVKGAEE